MKNYILIFAILLAFVHSGLAQDFNPSTDKNWFSQWSDNFNYTDSANFAARGLIGGINGGNKWTTSLWHTGPNDTTYETDMTVSGEGCHNIAFHGNDTPGYVTLTIRHESPPFHGHYHVDSTNTDVNRDYYFTRGVLNLPSVSGFKYGYVEMRFRLPDYSYGTGANSNKTNLFGLSAAFWMFDHQPSLDVDWSEIDMMEDFDGFNDHTANVHYSDNAHAHCCSGQSWYRMDPIAYTPVHFGGSFHTLGMEWAPNVIHFYVDHKLVSTNSQYNDKLVKMGLIVDLGVNGYPWADMYTNKYISGLTSLPYSYDIDYIKVWQLKMDHCGTPLSQCSLDPSTFDFRVWKSIEFTGVCSSTDLLPGTSTTLRAADYILIDKNFTVEKGAEFSMIPSPSQ